jgi:GH43 family beta-xylosidase
MHFALALALALCALLPLQASHAASFTNPVKPRAADPHISFKDGYYYFLFTTGDGVWVRRHSDFSKLGDAPASKVWGWNNIIKGHVWAPEIAYLNGRWYIYASGSLRADSSRPEDMRMFVLEANTENPLGSYTYKGLLTERSAIDASVWQNPESKQIWITWSQWAPEQSIYIAKMKSPIEIAARRVKISSPTQPWERDKWPVNEGPAFLPYGDKMHIVMSVNGCASPDYSLALLTAKKTDNWLDAETWQKSTGPVFTKDPGNGVFGPGHHSAFQDPKGQWWLAYHAVTSPNGACDDTRSTRVQPFDFDQNGAPKFGKPIALGAPIEFDDSNTTGTTPLGQTTWARIENLPSGKLLDVAGVSLDAGASIHQWSHTGGANQLWKIQRAENDSYFLIAKHSGMCLDVPGGGDDNGIALIQWQCHGRANQKWQLIVKDNAYLIRSVASGKCLDVEDFKTTDGAKIHQWDCHGGTNQLFRLKPAQ